MKLPHPESSIPNLLKKKNSDNKDKKKPKKKNPEDRKHGLTPKRESSHFRTLSDQGDSSNFIDIYNIPALPPSLWTCTHCSENNPSSLLTCKNCGQSKLTVTTTPTVDQRQPIVNQNLVPEDPAKTHRPRGTPEKKGKWVCAYCNGENGVLNKNCEFCGYNRKDNDKDREWKNFLFEKSKLTKPAKLQWQCSYCKILNFDSEVQCSVCKRSKLT